MCERFRVDVGTVPERHPTLHFTVSTDLKGFGVCEREYYKKHTARAAELR